MTMAACSDIYDRGMSDSPDYSFVWYMGYMGNHCPMGLLHVRSINRVCCKAVPHRRSIGIRFQSMAFQFEHFADLCCVRRVKLRCHRLKPDANDCGGGATTLATGTSTWQVKFESFTRTDAAPDTAPWAGKAGLRHTE